MTFSTKQLFGIYSGTLVFCGIINSTRVRIMAIINDASGWWHIVGTIVVCIMLPAVAVRHASAEYVFTSFTNNGASTGVNDGAYIFFLGLLMSQVRFGLLSSSCLRCLGVGLAAQCPRCTPARVRDPRAHTSHYRTLRSPRPQTGHPLEPLVTACYSLHAVDDAGLRLLRADDGGDAHRRHRGAAR